MKGKLKLVLTIGIVCIIATVFLVSWVNRSKQQIEIIVPEKMYGLEDVCYENEEVYIDSQILLISKENVDYRGIEKMVKKEGGEIIGYISFSNDYQINFPNGKSYEELNKLVEKWKNEEFCEMVSLNRVYKINDEVSLNDPWSEKKLNQKQSIDWNEENPKGNNWWAEAIRMPSVWKKYDWNQLADEHIKIGVIDSVFDENHAELSGVLKKTWQNIELSKENITFSEEEKEHGTHVAGIIAAEMGNEKGIAGVAACAEPQLYGFSMFGTEEHQYSGMMEYKYALALMLEQGVKVINISMGFDEMVFAAQQGNTNALKNLESCKNVMERFLKAALESGYEFLIAKSAGNHSGDYWVECEATKEHPYGYRKNSWGVGGKMICSAKYDFLGAITEQKVKDHIIIVGAAELSPFSETVGGTGYTMADYSNIDCDVYAPGTDILSTVPNDKIKSLDGTSMAAPIVSGVAGLMWTVNPELSAVQIKKIIAMSANYQMIGVDPVLDLEITRKNDVAIINAALAVNLAMAEKGETVENSEKEGVFLGRIHYEDLGEKKYIRDAEITIEHDETKVQVESLSSDEFGDFQVFLPEGNYVVIVDAGKFGTGEVNICIEEGKVIYSDIKVQSKYSCRDEDNKKSIEDVYEALIKASEITKIWKGFSEYNDETDTIIADYGDFDWIYRCVTYPDIHTFENLVELTKKYYSNEIVEKFLIPFQQYVEKDGKLYLPEPDGLGGPSAERRSIRIEKSTEQRYNIRIRTYYSDYNIEEDLKIYNYYYTTEGWIFDGLFDFSEDVPMYVEDDFEKNNILTGEYIELVGILGQDSKGNLIVNLEQEVNFEGGKVSEVGITGENYEYSAESIIGKQVLVYGKVFEAHTTHHWSRMMLLDGWTNLAIWE